MASRAGSGVGCSGITPAAYAIHVNDSSIMHR
jgi:hypothetical protein